MNTQSNDSFVQIMTLKGTNDWDLVLLIFIGQPDLRILKSDFEKAYEQVLVRCEKGNINSCNIKFLLVPDIVPKSKSLLDLCYFLCASFVLGRNLSARLPLLKKFIVNFTYDKDEMIVEKTYFPFNDVENAGEKPWWKF